MTLLAGRRAVITGGAGGLGLAMARRFRAEGARLSLWDRDGRALETARAELGPETHTVVVDVTDADAQVAAAQDAAATLGGLDVVVANAGILGPVAPAWEVSPEDFRRVTEVNLVGAFLTLRATVPHLLAVPRGERRGRVIAISSIQAKEGTAKAGAYAASKAGLIALVKSLAKDLACEAVLVNAIAPVAVPTAMMDGITAERRADLLARIPMGRFLEADEVAAMAAWLASDQCSFSTGAVFDLSGGRATW